MHGSNSPQTPRHVPVRFALRAIRRWAFGTPRRDGSSLIESISQTWYFVPPMTQPKSVESVRRAARMYVTNKEAAAALGIGARTFATICRENGIETPYVRWQRERRDGTAGSE